ncbi:hypothetical protein STEG23_032000 [Scotinomys teguina]
MLCSWKWVPEPSKKDRDIITMYGQSLLMADSLLQNQIQRPSLREQCRPNEGKTEEPEARERCCETVSPEHGAFAVMFPQQLWLLAQDLHKIKPDHLPEVLEEELKMPCP